MQYTKNCFKVNTQKNSDGFIHNTSDKITTEDIISYFDDPIKLCIIFKFLGIIFFLQVRLQRYKLQSKETGANINENIKK